MKTAENKFRNLRIEFHIIQSFPVTCLNRDDVGAPKTAVVGGVTRARVSSQCWKRQIRLAMHEFGIKLAHRTKHVDDLIVNAVIVNGGTEESARPCAEAVAACVSKDTLLFITDSEVTKLAEYAMGINFDVDKVKEADVEKLVKGVINKAVDGLDIALFGRMVAQAASLDIEAASSFSHAISTHKVTNEVEFFTALDDCPRPEEQGSSHMGSLEFNSATYYRYVSLDIGQLYDTLKTEEAIPQAIEAFIKALYVAVPSARQTTQSGASSWDFAKILVRSGQRLQLAFETPVKAKDGGFLNPSIESLKETLAKKEKLSGSLFGKKAEFTFGEDENFSIDDLVSSVISAIKV
ncbi:type I-E CRISPR-associated protein Cas7/Cse4/CasC [Treponema sp.]